MSGVGVFYAQQKIREEVRSKKQEDPPWIQPKDVPFSHHNLNNIFTGIFRLNPWWLFNTLLLCLTSHQDSISSYSTTKF